MDTEDMTEEEIYNEAVKAVRETGRATISFIQRKFRIGYNRAARIMEQMETEGVVSEHRGESGREVFAV